MPMSSTTLLLPPAAGEHRWQSAHGACVHGTGGSGEQLHAARSTAQQHTCVLLELLLVSPSAEGMCITFNQTAASPTCRQVQRAPVVGDIALLLLRQEVQHMGPA